VPFIIDTSKQRHECLPDPDLQKKLFRTFQHPLTLILFFGIDERLLPSTSRYVQVYASGA